MTIGAGSKLGPYEITAPLGAGGMGEVWAARDPRIGREVAIKILHPAMSANEDIVRRFEQEARTAGQLNHPNLIAVYDVGLEGEAAYLVTELLEGDTLRERLSGGALPFRRAIEWASGIASGLAAAHDKGIVHRDLKPENIFVTKDNRVKILDFGLARLTNAGVSDSGKDDAPTDHRTDPGKVMGTVGYMSPEQVRAQPVDHRSDIFSFGAILYEMLTGLRAFRRDSSIETMNAILKEEPPELTASNPNLHPGLERIVRHCLEKHPESRFQSARDMAFDLAALSSTSSSVPSIAGFAARKRTWIPIAAVVAAIALAAVAFVTGRSTAQHVASIDGASEARVTGFRRLTFRRGNIIHARLTKDGKVAVFSAAWDGRPMEVYTTQLADRVSRPLGIEKADVLSVSSKGEIALLLKKELFYATAGIGTLARVPLGGGVPRPVLENVQSADWGPDGESMAVIRFDTATNETVLEYPIGKELLRSKGTMFEVQVSPDGERVAFMMTPSPAVPAELRVMKRDGTSKTLGSSAGFGTPRWLGNDRVTIADYPTSSQLTFDMDGKRTVLLEAPSVEILDVTPDNTLLIEREIYRASISYGEAGLPAERDLGWLDGSVNPLLTSDGKLLFTEIGDGASDRDGSMFLRGVDGSPALMLGNGFAVDASHDGKWVLSQKQSVPDALYAIPTGTGLPREIRIAGMSPLAGGLFLPDGRRVIVIGASTDGSTQCSVYDLDSGKATAVGPVPVREGAVVSPDGLRFAFGKIGAGIAMQKLAGGQAEPVAGSEEGDVPVGWSGDGRTLWVVGSRTLPLPVYALDLASGKRSPWKQLMPPDPTGVIRVDTVRIRPDGRAWAYAYPRISDDDLITATLTGVPGR